MELRGRFWAIAKNVDFSMPLRGVEKSIKIGPWAPKGRHARCDRPPGSHQVATKSATAWLEGPRGGPNIKDNRQIYENNDDGGRSDTPLGRRPGELKYLVKKRIRLSMMLSSQIDWMWEYEDTIIYVL